MKRIAYVLSALLAVSGCSRNASEGNIVLQVLDFRDRQPLGLEASVAKAPAFRTTAAKAATDAAEQVPNVCLVESTTPAKELGTITASSDCAFGDADGMSQFTREEGAKIALADVNGDGKTDSITYGVTPGSRDYVEVTKVNYREDGGWILTKNDKVIYHPGDTIVVHVYGWVPKAEKVHVELWNNWNGGFHYWSSATREVNGDIDYEVQMVIPSDWPQTNESTGAAYFSYPVSPLGVYNGDNFVILDGSNGQNPPDTGNPPVNGSIVIAGGAAAVSSTTVSLRLAAKDAAFFRLANSQSGLEGVPWTELASTSGTNVPWMLAAGPDGQREVFVQYAGKFGAVSEVASDTVLLDATPIEIRSLAATPTLGGAATTYQISFTLSEPAAGSLRGTFGATPLTGLTCNAALQCTATHTVAGGDVEGPVVITVRAEDAVGWADTERVTVSLDLTPPETTLTGNVPAGVVPSNNAGFGLASDESPVTYECSLDGAAFAACPAAVTLLGQLDGPHDFAARAIDAAGNVDATPATAAWTVDTSAPDTVILLAPAGTTNSARAVIAFTSPAADVAGYECRVDGATFTACTSPATLTALADRGHSFEVRAVDGAGNYDLTPATATWTVDTTPPETLLAAAPSGTVTSALANIVFYSTATDLAGFECSVGYGDFAPCASPQAVTTLVNGPQTFRVRAHDAAGNVDPTPATANWVVSLVPPETTLVSGPTGSIRIDSPDFTFVSDKPGTFECRIDAGVFLACTTPHTEPGLADGMHVFQVRAKDTEGVVDPTPASRTFTVDTTPPETTLTSAPPAVTRSTAATLLFTADEPASFQCDLDGNSGLGYVSCATPFSTVGLADGPHVFSVRALDTAGNLDASPASVTWTVDTRPPDVANLVASAPRSTTGDTLTLTFDTSEPPAGLLVTVAGRAALLTSVFGTHYTYTYIVAGDEPGGTVNVTAAATDAAGNIGKQTITTELDFLPPDTLITSAPPAFTNGSSAIVDFASSEAGSTFECQVAGAGFAPCTAPYTETPLFEGMYVFDVRAVDSVGLVDPTPARATWRVDHTACPAPVAAKMSVTVQPPLTSDQLTGSAGAVEAGATVKVYADANLSIVLASIPATGGSFPATNIGDDVGDAAQQVYVTCTDQAGNEGAATPMRNPRIAPRVTRALVTISLFLDSNGKSGYGNPGDWIKVDWDNSADGDNNPGVTSVSGSVPALGIGSITMINMGSGKYTGVARLNAGTFDGTAAAQITVVGEAGLTTGPVQSANTVQVDVEAPLPPGSISGGTTGSQLAITWSASPSIDVAFYAPFTGTTAPPASPLPALSAASLGTIVGVESCTDQYFGVEAVDDAGNVSARIQGGPVSVTVDKPQIATWGGIGAAAAKVLASDRTAAVQVHFAMVTEAVGAPPWTSAYPQFHPSPITAVAGINRVTPLKGGTRYVFQARAVKNTCTSAFTDPQYVTTLYATSHNGGFAICPGCTYWGFPGRWYFGSLGFAVAGVGDAYGADGKEDVITAVPGQTLALLVGGDPLDEVAYMYDYYATNDVVGGGPELASAGDVNGDGKEDFLMGSPATSSTGKMLRGMARVIDGVTHATLFTVWGDQAGQQLGYSVSSAGDLTGDGKSEILAGSIGCMSFSCSDTTATAGIVKVVRSDGTLLRTHTGSVVGSFFGVSVHGGVDVTGDGVPDYVVGAPGHTGAGAPIGSVHVYNGATGAEVRTLYGQSDEKFGFAVRLGRANGTAGGAPRIYVGAPSRTSTPGKVYVYDMAGVQVAVYDGALPEASVNFGASLTSGGDMSGDGVDEVVVGDPNIPLSSQYGTGKAYAYSVDENVLTFELFGDTTDGGFGYAMDFLTDFNGDGVNDLVIGAPGAAVDGIWNAGKLYFISISAN
jgi:hypothetical protein